MFPIILRIERVIARRYGLKVDQVLIRWADNLMEKRSVSAAVAHNTIQVHMTSPSHYHEQEPVELHECPCRSVP